MVSQRVATIANRLSREGTFDPTRRETEGLSPQEKNQLEDIISERQSGGVAQQIQVTQFKEATGFEGDVTIQKVPERFGGGGSFIAGTGQQEQARAEGLSLAQQVRGEITPGTTGLPAPPKSEVQPADIPTSRIGRFASETKGRLTDVAVGGFQDITQSFGRAEEIVSRRIASPVIERFGGIERVSSVFGLTAPSFAEPGISILPSEKERRKNIQESRSLLEDITQEPLKQVVTFEVGRALGIGLKAGRTGAGFVGETIGGVRGLQIAQRGFTGAETLGFGSLAAVDIGGQVFQEPLRTPEIISETSKEFFILGLGARAGGKTKVFETEFKFQQGLLGQEAQRVSLVKQGAISEEAGFQLKEAINLQRTLRGLPDPAITGRIDIPGGTASQRKIFKQILDVEGSEVFGGQTLKLRGSLRETGDIDIFIPKTETEVISFTKDIAKQLGGAGADIIIGKGKGGTSLGIRGSEKAFDIKGLEVQEQFLLKQEPIISPEGFGVTRLSEQTSRALSGTLELRKGGKDITDFILGGRALIGEGAKADKGGFLDFFRQRKLSKAERKLSGIEGIVPELSLIAERAGGDPLGLKIPKRRGFLTDEPEPLFPEFGKRATFGRDVRQRDTINLNKRIANAFEDLNLGQRKTKKGRGRPSEISEFLPSKISSSSFLPSSIKPSRILPSRIKPSSFLPSRITPSGIDPFKPSGFDPSGFDPSKFKPSTIDPFKPSGFDPSSFTPTDGGGFDPFKDTDLFSPPDLDRRKKKFKKKKGKRIRTRIAPSLTGEFLANLGDFGSLPKEFKNLGILPTQIRRVRKPKAKKKK